MPEVSKICFKCGERKPLNDYYKNKTMKDGYLNKCKECTKSDVRRNRAENIEYYREYDKGRANLPHRVAGREAYQKTDAYKVSHNKACKNYYYNNPIKTGVHNLVSNMIRGGKIARKPCEICGNEK